MHGRGGEDRRRSVRHMRSVPAPGTTTKTRTLACSSTAVSFSKDDRKISVGDCALFKPPQDFPPFIGIIRSLTLNGENILQLGVNWLYRPSEVKLGEGILVDAAPNEVFYSFHKDEIPAASLLHPCKVAFLPEGAKLPSGVSSFVCRRVYDIAHKCLWWLSDRNYINERQEEVDKLLHKTRIEMHATVQPGGHSPKQIHGPTSTSQLKPSSDVPSGTSFASQVRGKKRERADQISEPAKREGSLRTDDGDSGQFQTDGSLKSELSKITERGGLVDSEGGEKLLRLMQSDRAERKMDISSRSTLAGVIVATDNFDCLSRFVQLKGLTILDAWLQDIHKGKIADDSSVEELLLVLLCALDKLPVNLHALQMCHIGKSVNHLRTHKNLEIQKKARTLVDTWKKRVQAEMNMTDSKSGSTQAVSWPSRSRLQEVSQAGNRHTDETSEGPAKSSVIQISASKTDSFKPIQGESSAKSASSSPRLMRSARSPPSSKDGQSRYIGGSTCDIPSTTAREEKSSSSNQSHNNSQSCSNDHTKIIALSGKEDAKSSTAVSVNMNKFSASGSRHRKSNNVGSGGFGAQRETRSNRTSSLNRNAASGKVSQSGLTVETQTNVPVVESNTNKLIVKIPNKGRSPSQSASGGSFEGPSIMNSRVSSPVVSEKHDQFYANSKEKNDAYRANVASDVNTESWQSNDFKDVLTGSDEGDGSPAIPDEERSGTGDDARKLVDVSKVGFSSSGNELKSGKSNDSSFSSMNALIESCVKHSEGNASMSIGDDGGMNLLASVAAGEMSKSDLGSPTDYPQKHTIEDSCMIHEIKPKTLLADDLGRGESQFIDDVVTEKQAYIAGTLCSRDEPHGPNHALSTDHFDSSNRSLQHNADTFLETTEMSEVKGATSGPASLTDTTEKVMVVVEESKQLQEREAVATSSSVDATPDTKPKDSSSLLINNKASVDLPTVEVGTLVVESSLLEIDRENPKKMNEGWGNGVHTDQVPSPAEVHSAHTEMTGEGISHPSVPGSVPTSESNRDSRVGEGNEMVTESHINRNEQKKNDQNAGGIQALDNPVKSGLDTAITDQKNEFVEAIESKEDLETHSETVDCAPTKVDATSLHAPSVMGMVVKPKFDLNDGFGEPFDGVTPGCSAAVHLVNPSSFNSLSSGLPASVTVAAAAKGPFVPPKDLMRSKGELGWKGSAATSAFRPTEPRKVLDMPLGSTTIPSPDSTSGKNGRPPLDIDLNVPDERVLDEICFTSDHIYNCNLPQSGLMGSAPPRGSGGLDLDLNRTDEANDMVHPSTSIGRRMDGPLLPIKSSLFGAFPDSDVRRDFDLNGPAVNEVSVEPSSSSFVQHGRISMQSQPTVSGLRMNSAEIGNFSSWFQPGNYLPDRGDRQFPVVAPGGPQRISGPATGGTLFTSDLYRGSILSSSPAAPFPSSPFQYPVFPFGNSFPLPPTSFSGGTTTFTDSSGGRLCFPAVNPQLTGSTSVVSSQTLRPYTVSLHDGVNNVGIESNRRWDGHGLDLNVGPGGSDAERGDETLPVAPRQLSIASSQALGEQQARMYNVAGGVWKRKEPEGGWDAESFRYKQSSWQ